MDEDTSAVVDVPSNKVTKGLQAALDAALRIQRPSVVSYVDRIKAQRPDSSPAEIVSTLEKRYLATVATLGAAAGGTAAVPGLGTSTSVVLSASEIGSFFEATALFTLAVAEVHGVPVEDLARRRTLVLAVALGQGGAAVVEKAAGRSGAYWGRMLTQSIPLQKINSINKVLGRHFVTKYGTKQGILILGRALPFGLGAVIGTAGNSALGYGSVQAARRAFGPAPQVFTEPPTIMHEDNEIEQWGTDAIS